MILEEKDFIDINAFSLSYRWTHNNYWKASKTELGKIKPIFPNTAKKLWETFSQKTFGETSNRLTIKMLSTPHFHVCRIKEDQTDVIQWLTSHLPDDCGQIIIFWEPIKAVMTQPSLFLSHWDDFCYPASDDVMVWPLNGEWVLHYSHGETFYFKKM